MNGTLLQGYYGGGEGQTMLGAAVVEMEEGIRYLYVAQDSGTVVKVNYVFWMLLFVISYCSKQIVQCLGSDSAD